jgi:hypothetical protein
LLRFIKPFSFADKGTYKTENPCRNQFGREKDSVVIVIIAVLITAVVGVMLLAVLITAAVIAVMLILVIIIVIICMLSIIVCIQPRAVFVQVIVIGIPLAVIILPVCCILAVIVLPFGRVLAVVFVILIKSALVFRIIVLLIYFLKFGDFGERRIVRSAGEDRSIGK